MSDSQMEFLTAFGWSEFFKTQEITCGELGLFPGRVISEEKGVYRIQFGMNELMWAIIPGKWQFEAKSRIDFPAVGDWVIAHIPENSDRAVIRQILNRKSILRRKQVGTGTEEQLIATNVDLIFITTSLNQDYNSKRVERYLTLARDSGAKPILLLTKSDLFQGDVEEFLIEARQKFVGVDIYLISQNDFQKAVFLKEILTPGITSVFVGSSGVGKSTLVNYLIGQELIETQGIRELDGKGRHTTTARYLFQSRFGGLVIDTPGMREIQLSDHEDGFILQFQDVEELFQKCKFRDCTHESEPGCHVKECLKDGKLEKSRWEHYQKLAREIQFQLRKEDKSLTAKEKELWRKRTLEMRHKAKGK